jgi:hypothetical protein
MVPAERLTSTENPMNNTVQIEHGEFIGEPVEVPAMRGGALTEDQLWIIIKELEPLVALKGQSWKLAEDHLRSVLAAPSPITDAVAPAGMAPPLSADHRSMRVDYQGLLSQSRNGLRREPALAEMLRQLTEHLTELGERFYAGELTAVDEFLQLYCIGRERRATLAASPAATQPEAEKADAGEGLRRALKAVEWALIDIEKCRNEHAAEKMQQAARCLRDAIASQEKQHG